MQNGFVQALQEAVKTIDAKALLEAKATIDNEVEQRKKNAKEDYNAYAKKNGVSPHWYFKSLMIVYWICCFAGLAILAAFHPEVFPQYTAKISFVSTLLAYALLRAYLSRANRRLMNFRVDCSESAKLLGHKPKL